MGHQQQTYYRQQVIFKQEAKLIITDKIRVEQSILFAKRKAMFEKILFKKFYKALNEVSYKAINAGNTNVIELSVLYQAYIDSYLVIFKRYSKQASDMVLKADNPTINISFFSQYFVNAVKSHLLSTAGERIKNVDDNTKQKVRDILDKNSRSGSAKSAYQMRREIGIFNKSRAMLIARTESLMAMNHVAHESAIKEGVTTKAWLHTIGRSKNYREEHLALNEKPIPIKDKFYVNGVYMNFPGDPNGGAVNNCNCRCSILYGYGDATAPNQDNLFQNFIAGMVINQIL